MHTTLVQQAKRAETFGFIVVSFQAVLSIALTLWSRRLHDYEKLALTVLLAAMWLAVYSGQRKHKEDNAATWAALMGYGAVLLLLK